MTTKGTYKLTYTLDKELKDLIVTVELCQAEGINIPRRNVWCGHVVVSDRAYTEDLSHCVNALLAAERIGVKLRTEIKEKAKLEGKSFRIKNETIK
jgi:hypothetical protein